MYIISGVLAVGCLHVLLAYLLLVASDRAEPKPAKRRRRETGAGIDSLPDCSRLSAVISSIIQSTNGAEFSASVAAAGMSLSLACLMWPKNKQTYF